MAGRRLRACHAGLITLPLASRHYFYIIEDMRRRDYLGHLELMVLLAVWRLKSEAYGVSIAKEIEQQCGYSLALAGIYSTLERLQEKGFVRSTRGDPTPERGGRARMYFDLTPTGLQETRATFTALNRLAPKAALS
jgi:PadR family transcriptional regulator, regulatory protein PadR